jgi:hypothetical protein
MQHNTQPRFYNWGVIDAPKDVFQLHSLLQEVSAAAALRAVYWNGNTGLIWIQGTTKELRWVKEAVSRPIRRVSHKKVPSLIRHHLLSTDNITYDDIGTDLSHADLHRWARRKNPYHIISIRHGDAARYTEKSGITVRVNKAYERG